MNEQEMTRFCEKNAYARLTGIRVKEARPGYAVAEMPVRDEHKNPFGTVNAGAIFTLAETAFGMAANADGQVGLAVNLAISYFKPGLSGTLTAKARQVAPGRRLCSYLVEVFDDSGEMIASVQAMAYKKNTPLSDLPGWSS